MSLLDSFIYRDSNLRHFIPDQTISLRQWFVRYLPGVQFEQQPLEPDFYVDWYPYVNSYYPFTEDVDAFARVSHIIENKESADTLSNHDLATVIQRPCNEYSTQNIYLQYLTSKPACFLLLGKPGLGQEDIGRRLAEYWKCVYIDPQVLIEEEIPKGSRAGQCIEYNLRCGRAIGVEIIMRLLARKIQTPYVLHRGYVLSGFPLIYNDLYTEDPISSESAVFTVQEIFEDIVDATMNIIDTSDKVEVSIAGSSKAGFESVVQKSEIELPHEASQFRMTMSWSLESDIYPSELNVAIDLEKQVNILFGLFRDPFIIIYIYGLNSDVIAKRDNYYFDPVSEQSLDMEKIKLFLELGASNEHLVEDLFDDGRNPFAGNANLRHIVKMPENLVAHVRTQLDRYHNCIANNIDSRVVLYDQAFYIKLDGRRFFAEMMQLIKHRLKILSIPPVLVPERFRLGTESGEGGGPTPEMTLNEAFNRFFREDLVSSIHPWVLSDWKHFCPVSMAKGVYKKGSPQWAVHFLNKIFFLADEAAFFQFVENPRACLMSNFPKPGSKIFLYGPPISGKTAVANCLGYVLNAKVMNFGTMEEEYFLQLVAEHSKQVKQAAITEALELLKEKKAMELEQKLEERRDEIKNWKDRVTALLLQFIEAKEEAAEPDVSDLLPKLNIHDLNTCKALLEDPEQLHKYLPEELREEPQLEQATVLDEFVLDYANERVAAISNVFLREKLHANKFEVFARAILEPSNYEGWIIDSMTRDVELLSQIFENFPPNEVVILETDDVEFLVKRCQASRSHPMQFYEYRKFFEKHGEIDAMCRTPSFDLTNSFIKQLVIDIIDDVLLADLDSEGKNSQREQNIEKYRAEILAYQEELRSVEEFLKDIGVVPIKINITDLKMEHLLQDSINALRDKYRRTGYRLTDEQLAQELQLIYGNKLQNEEGEGDTKADEEFFQKSRMYGDTSIYCPVTFAKKFVLWRGKKEFAVRFKGKIYLLADEAKMKIFLKSPRSYLKEHRPPNIFPPLRVCVVGVPCCGKTYISKALAKNMGTRYIEFDAIQKEAINRFSSMSLLVTDVASSLLFDWYDSVFNTLWFNKGLKSFGFILDGFPQKPRDLNYQVSCSAIPDAILHIVVNREEQIKKVLERSIAAWREELVELKQQHDSDQQLIRSQWEEARTLRFRALMEEKRQERYVVQLGSSEGIPTIPEENEDAFESDTQISLHSLDDQRDEQDALRILDEELPEPEYGEFNEDEELISAQLLEEIEGKFDAMVQHLAEMKEICERELIPWIEIDGSLPLDMLKINAFMVMDQYKFRGGSFFERCYELSLEIAEKLIECGYCCLSCFGRSCPVTYFLGYNTMHTFPEAYSLSYVRPVMHRQYIYYMCGEKNLKLFLKNPLKYVNPENFFLSIIPIRIAVVGPPKSGKTAIARRFESRLGGKTLSRGKAIRETLEHVLMRSYAKPIDDLLRRGEQVTDDMVGNCINFASDCGEDLNRILIFDGFPASISELKILSRLGLVPHLIIDLQASSETVLEHASLPFERGYLTYSWPFIEHVLEEWRASEEIFRSWTDREYQNIYKLPVDRSIWGVWDQVKNITFAVVFERKHYYKHIKWDWPLRLGNMLVTPLEFLERCSGYKSYCPVCLYESRRLICSGDPPDRTGLVQFRRFFYWICADHIERFLKVPEKYMPPSNITLPQNLPTRLDLSSYPDNAVHNGYCVVCYGTHFPDTVLRKGLISYAVAYLSKIYLFDCLDCLKYFMAVPHELCGVTIYFKQSEDYPPLGYTDLPVLGMLEQYVARTIVRACGNVNLYRPVIPGLTIASAALVCVGLNLKIYNKSLEQDKTELYKDALEKFHERRLNLIKYCDLMKQYLNPFVHYEEPDMPALAMDEDQDSRRVPVPDERFEYLCEYFKPASKVPAFLNVVDIAGLVKGAAEGQGLGNAFLSHISACDTIFHLCRAFEDDDVTHVEGDINPVRDLDIIAEELRLKDEDTLMKNLEKLERTVVRGNDKKLKPEYDTLVKIKGVLVDEKKHIRFGDWDVKDIEVLNKYLFLTSKPTIYLVNLAEKDYIKKKNKWLIEIKKWVDGHDPGALIIPFSGAFEHKLVEEYEDAALRKKYLEDLGTTSALDKIIIQGYKALQLEYFFTAGADEVKAWTIQKGTKAPQAAGRIHTDFEKGFIMAEVMKFADFKEEGSETACKAAGKYRQQGRNYVVEDGDVIFFKFNAGAGLKDAKKK